MVHDHKNPGVTEIIKGIVSRMAMFDQEDIDPMMNLRNIGVDQEELAAQLRKRWRSIDFPGDEVNGWRTVEDVVRFLERREK